MGEKGMASSAGASGSAPARGDVATGVPVSGGGSPLPSNPFQPAAFASPETNPGTGGKFVVGPPPPAASTGSQTDGPGAEPALPDSRGEKGQASGGDVTPALPDAARR